MRLSVFLLLLSFGAISHAHEEEEEMALTTPEPDECDEKTFGTKVMDGKRCICMKYNFVSDLDKTPSKIHCMPDGCEDDEEKLIPIGGEGQHNDKKCKCLDGAGPNTLEDAPMQPVAHWDPKC